MNKSEKLIVAVLGLLLVAYLGWNFLSAKSAPAPSTPAEPVAATATVPATIAPVEAPAPVEATSAAAQPALLAEAMLSKIENDVLALEVSTHDATLTTATLKAYPEKNEAGSKPVTLNLSNLLKIATPESLMPRVFTLKSQTNQSITLTAPFSEGLVLERTITLDATGYHLVVSDQWKNSLKRPVMLPASTLSAGAMMGSPADLAVGSYDTAEEETVLRAAQGMGCGCSCSETLESAPTSTQRWLALSNRYFLSLLAPQSAKTVTLNLARPQNPSAEATISGAFTLAPLTLAAGATSEERYHLYIGPKVYDNLVALEDLAPVAEEAAEMMDFGMFAWFSKLLLKGMNFFYGLIPNYGIAIILLTILVRVIFWPLTRKSTLAMRKMSEIQPLIKEVQEKFKGNPQKIQQETFMLYRKYQVNPLASCLPMLIQIPIFIAFFTMLRSVSELRFAGFLWISDLSQPENLFAGVLPIAINILPILTAVTMALQSHLTPSAGDPSQKKMMTWMMPIMMLFFFYNMSSALCLYWTVSQLLSIAQMYMLRKTTPKQA